MRPVKILIRLRGGAGWSESSLGAYVQRYVSWRRGSTVLKHCAVFTLSIETSYRIRPNYRAVRLGFSKVQGNFVVNYDSTYQGYP